MTGDDDERHSNGTGIIVIVAVVALACSPSCCSAAARAAAGASRSSWRRGAPFVNPRWLAGKVAAALLTFAFVLVNFFLFRVMGVTSRLACRASHPAGDRASGRRTGSTSR